MKIIWVKIKIRTFNHGLLNSIALEKLVGSKKEKTDAELSLYGFDRTLW